MAGTAHDVTARELRVLVDADLTSWDAWNQFATAFAEDVGARVVAIADGGVTGPAFHEHCLRLRATSGSRGATRTAPRSRRCRKRL